MLVSSSILAADFSKLGEEILAAQKAGTDWIHLDVMDGHFVPNFTFGYHVIKKLRKITDITYDVHLMVIEPEKMLQDFIESGVDSITLHYEYNPKLPSLLQKIKDSGLKASISINPDTSVDVLEPFLEIIDMILIMTVKPGFGGQKLIPDCLEKVRVLKRKRDQNPERYKYLIQVDGGINASTIKDVKDAGVDVVVAGSFVFKSEDYAKSIKIMHDS